MLEGLPCIITVLLDNRQPLEALPLIAMLEWLTQHVLADLAATVAARLQRACALTQLGLLAEAASVITALMQVMAEMNSRKWRTAKHSAKSLGTPGWDI